ncbi:MAG: hypothetical protein COA97_12055 [Flavobacteriales bacterium]|nr:MAG: hypothetical protein COA97_12055 [Flavobacteriales bacterium]
MKNEEIDLFDLYSAFKKTRFYSSLNKGILFIFDNNIWFALFLIIGAIGGYFIEKNETPIYRSEMIVDSKFIDNYTCNQIVLSLNTLISDGNFSECEKLGLKKEIYSEIRWFEFLYPEQGADSLKMTEPFRIAINTTNNANFLIIEKSLLTYLISTPYSIKNQTTKLDELLVEKEILSNEITALDSMQLLINKSLKAGLLKENAFNPSSLIKEKKNAQLRLSVIEKEILNINNFEVLKSFTPTNTPIIYKNYYLLKLSLLSFVFGFVVLRLFKK